MTMASNEEVLKVNREKLAACVTCPICHKLFTDATTISECLHSFCRKCIHEKITEDEIDRCPVCSIDLGCDPLEKLRADHNLQDLRLKIFPRKRQNSERPESVSSIPLPPRRKERSLTSLASSTPESSAKSSSNGRREKVGPKDNLALQEFTSPIEDLVKDAKVGDLQEISYPEPLNRTTQTKRQSPSPGELSTKHTFDNSTDDSARPLEGKADLWKPLNVLVEAASKTKANSRGTVGRPIFLEPSDNDPTPNEKLKEFGNSPKVHGNENEVLGSSGPGRRRKSVGRPKKAAASEGTNFSLQDVVDGNPKFDGSFSPIWFSLVASDEQEGDEPLPQIPSCYLRVKDGRLPVSFIKKYIVKKLNLTSEAEVEISLWGRPVLSTLEMHNLINWWAQTSSASERIQTAVGRSAKDFVMVLSYGRKAQSLTSVR